METLLVPNYEHMPIIVNEKLYTGVSMEIRFRKPANLTFCI